jgi:hypothetical protein
MLRARLRRTSVEGERHTCPRARRQSRVEPHATRHPASTAPGHPACSQGTARFANWPGLFSTCRCMQRDAHLRCRSDAHRRWCLRASSLFFLVFRARSLALRSSEGDSLGLVERAQVTRSLGLIACRSIERESHPFGSERAESAHAKVGGARSAIAWTRWFRLLPLLPQLLPR